MLHLAANLLRCLQSPNSISPPFSDDIAPTLLQIRELPPLVSTAEISHLSGLLASLACSSSGFVLQGGDCAEMFADCRAHAIDAKVALLKELSDIVRPAAGHVITIGRIAGQVPLFDSHSQTKTILYFVSVLQAEKQRHGNHQQRLSASKLQVAPAMHP